MTGSLKNLTGSFDRRRQNSETLRILKGILFFKQTERKKKYGNFIGNSGRKILCSYAGPPPTISESPSSDVL